MGNESLKEHLNRDALLPNNHSHYARHVRRDEMKIKSFGRQGLFAGGADEVIYPTCSKCQKGLNGTYTSINGVHYCGDCY